MPWRILGAVIFIGIAYLIPYVKFTYRIGETVIQPVYDPVLLLLFYYWMCWWVILLAMTALKAALKTTWQGGFATALLLLGIAAGVIAVTKTAAAGAARVAEVRAQIEARTRGTPAAAWPVFEVSSVSGAGVAELDGYLRSVAGERAARSANGHFRMAVDRCFTLAGVGTVVTGTVHTGRVESGANVALVPGPHGALTARVRSIHAQDRRTSRERRR